MSCCDDARRDSSSALAAWVLPVVVLLLAGTGCMAPGWSGSTTARAHPPVPEPARGATPQVGFSPGFRLLTARPSAAQRELKAIKGLGADWVRVDISWARIEAHRGDYAWASTDRVVDAARAAGLSVLAIDCSEPNRAFRYDSEGALRPPSPPQFAQFAGAAARRYAGTVRAWEVWNEPNSRHFWPSGPNSSAYARLLRPTSEAIRDHDPGATVLAGGLAPAVDAADGSQISPETFLRDLYRVGASTSFDAVAVHPYSFPALPEAPKPWNTFYRLPDLHRIMRDHGDADAPLWLTEFGAPTGPAPRAVTPRRQTKILVHGYREASQLHFVNRLFFYSYRDLRSGHTALERHFGVVSHRWRHKPAHAALKRELTG